MLSGFYRMGDALIQKLDSVGFFDPLPSLRDAGSGGAATTGAAAGSQTRGDGGGDCGGDGGIAERVRAAQLLAELAARAVSMSRRYKDELQARERTDALQHRQTQCCPCIPGSCSFASCAILGVSFR